MFTRRRTKRRGKKWLAVPAVIGVAWLVWEAQFWLPKNIQPPAGYEPVVVEMKTTAYCHCRKCCSYKWMLFIPYQKRGAFGFRLKHVGVTSSGEMVRPGSLAADTSIYPYGTVMHIPGYGYGRVEDTGGAIKGRHIDLYRPNHWWARKWGVRKKKVTVWLPPKPEPWFFDPKDAQNVQTNEIEVKATVTNKVSETNMLPQELEVPVTNPPPETSSIQNPLP